MPRLAGINILYLVLVAALLAAGGAWAWNAFSWLRKERWETAPLAADRIERVRLEERDQFSIDRVRFYSREMKEPRFFLALVPKTGTPPQEVFILSHGWFDRPEYLLKYLKVDQTYASLLAAGAVRPAILVLPDVRFPDYFRRNRRRFPFAQYLTLVAEEVFSAVSREYGIAPDRQRWSLGGFSFGGFLSLDVARRYPGRFRTVSVVSAFTDKDWKLWGETVTDPGPLDAQGRGLQTVVVPGPTPRILLACGTDDRFFPQVKRLHEHLNQLGIPHEWSTGPGGHTWEYWHSVLDRMFRFHLGG